MSARIEDKRPRDETDAAGEGSAALGERLDSDIARGLENVPVSAWPPGEWPEPFQYSPDLVAGPGADADPSQLSFPGCECWGRPCLPGSCSCLRHGENYDASLRLRTADPAATCTRPVFECHALCPCGEDCGNRLVQRGLQLRLQVFRAGAKGWGLRALDPVPRGSFVCEYAGEVLGAGEAQRRSALQGPKDPNYIQAVREYAGSSRQVLQTFVDPARLGNVGRFLNHSCQPNLLMLPVRVHSMVPRLALFAARDIPPGEELSYDYSGRFQNGGSDSEGEERPEPDMPRKPCLCGASSCKAFLPYDASLYKKAKSPLSSRRGEPTVLGTL